MVKCVSFTDGIVTGRQTLDCGSDSGGFSFWVISKAPTADQLPKICASSTCMAIVAAMKKAQPTECVVGFDLALYGEVISPIEAVCSGKPVAATPAPAATSATPAATPAVTPASTPPPTTATPEATAAPRTVATQATPASPVANGTTALDSTNAATSAMATAPPASQAATNASSSGSSSQLTLIIAIVGIVIVVVAIVGFLAYRAGNKRKRRRRGDDDYYHTPRRERDRREEPDARFVDIEAVRHYANRAPSKATASSMAASNATTATSVASTTGKSSNSSSRNGGSMPAAPMLEGAWNDWDIRKARIKYDEIVLNTAVGRLGHGGFCEVMAATLRSQNLEVAVKRLLPDLRHKDDMQKMLLDEVKTMNRLKHEHIVQLIGVAWHEPTDLCIVMELVKGTDMGSYISFAKANNHERGFNTINIKMALQIADALAYLHRQSPPVIHRDLKSHNILLTDKYQAKLADFGVTRENNATLKTSQIGTPKWMAPELALSRNYDAQVDIFSFGVLLSELDTFEEPYSQSFNGRKMTDMEFFESVRSGRLEVTFSGGNSDPVAQLGRACVRVLPRNRPTAAELVRRLQEILVDFEVRDENRKVASTF